MSNTAAPEPSQETASLVKRLAGPSTTKAGLAKDQSEINRIIAEASKGSQFYENEKRKDKDLTQRIERILQQRDEALKGVDLSSIERKVDHLLLELEAERDLSQIIVHVDMDAFYANVELLDNPSLAQKPFGVGWGVLTTASYEARKYGVRSGMPSFIAQKLCPELTIVPIHMSRYSEMSKIIMNIFRQYDPDLLAASVDEAYLNITAYCDEHGLKPEACVQKMRQQVVDETKLTVSAGIAANKMLAKICSDKNKPNGQFCLPHESKAIINFMSGLSIRKIPGVGRVNERLLESVGIKTCGDILMNRAMLSLMDKQFGLNFLLRTHLGIASNIVHPWQREERKSIGAERTFHSISDPEKIFQKLDEIAEELEGDMERGGWTGKTVTLKYKLDTYQVFTRAKSFNRWITKKSDLLAIGKELLHPELPLCIRLIGLRVTKLKDLCQPDSHKGIKRFFEPTSGSEGSPTKRQKAIDVLDDDEYGEAMPGYHELEPDVWDVDAEGDVHDPATSERKVAVIRPDKQHNRPSVSAPASSSRVALASDRLPSRTTKLVNPGASTSSLPLVSNWHDQAVAALSSASRHSSRRVSNNTLTSEIDHLESKSRKKDPQDIVGEHSLECPLCAQKFTDNGLLNSHVDWCLSREAIRAAQTEAGTNVSTKNMKKQGTEDDNKKGLKEWWKRDSPKRTGEGSGKRGRGRRRSFN